MAEQLEDWYLIFDDQDMHPVIGESMGGRYVALTVPDQETARREACRRFGDQWAALVPVADAGPDFAHVPLEPDGLWSGAFGDQALGFERTFGSHYAGRR
jgi:hypothetical protein